MKPVKSWEALTRPGCATEYFALGAPPLCVDGYDPPTAWWLSEVTRLIYRQEVDELGASADGLTRSSVLEGIGWHEAGFWNRRGNQAALLERADGSGPLVLVFRGTSEPLNWVINFRARPRPWTAGGQVHQGFAEGLEAVWPDLAPRIGAVRDTMLVCGHSLGGALAVLAATRLAHPVTYTFGAPRVGTVGFEDAVTGRPMYRVVNGRDLVADVPPAIGPRGFRHLGELIQLGSPARRPSRERLQDLMQRDRWKQPPSRLADHAPWNYSARLEEVVRG